MHPAKAEAREEGKARHVYQLTRMIRTKEWVQRVMGFKR